MIHFNFAWGEPFAVREAFSDLGAFNQILSFDQNMHHYLPHDFTPGNLERTISEYLEKTVGKKYHVMITPGGLNGVHIATQVIGKPIYYDKLHFSFYRSALNGVAIENPVAGATYVTASPSNPEGEIKTFTEPVDGNIIWDMAYGTLAYSKIPYIYPKHTAAVGSLGKTVGIPGLRLGWIASEDPIFIKNCWENMIHNTIGYSTLSYAQADLITVNSDFLISATTLAGGYIDDNRETMRKLEYLSEERAVPENGMFWWTKPSTALLKYFEKNKTTYVNGSVCGGDNSFIRVSLGQKRKATKDMVASILRLDKR